MYRIFFLAFLASFTTASLSAQSPTYVVLKRASSPMPHSQAKPNYSTVHAQPYAYGYFGAQSSRMQRSQHNGYYERHTQWNWR